MNDEERVIVKRLQEDINNHALWAVYGDFLMDTGDRIDRYQAEIIVVKQEIDRNKLSSQKQEARRERIRSIRGKIKKHLIGAEADMAPWENEFNWWYGFPTEMRFSWISDHQRIDAIADSLYSKHARFVDLLIFKQCLGLRNADLHKLTSAPILLTRFYCQDTRLYAQLWDPNKPYWPEQLIERLIESDYQLTHLTFADSAVTPKAMNQILHAKHPLQSVIVNSLCEPRHREYYQEQFRRRGIQLLLH